MEVAAEDAAVIEPDEQGAPVPEEPKAPRRIPRRCELEGDPGDVTRVGR
jgi:hypothetical protein